MTNTLEHEAENASARKGLVRVASFVDWNSQLLLTNVDYKRMPLEAARLAFRQTTRRIARRLSDLDFTAHYQVSLRLYHGWHKGFEPTANMKALRSVIGETDFSTASDKPNVSFSENVGWGACLLSALPSRYHQKLGVHLPNTLRDRGHQGHEEKMVDTALAADLVFSAFRDPNDWILLATEDDDLIPPLFTAESIVAPQSARAILLSNRRHSGNFLKLDGLE